MGLRILVSGDTFLLVLQQKMVDLLEVGRVLLEPDRVASHGLPRPDRRQLTSAVLVGLIVENNGLKCSVRSISFFLTPQLTSYSIASSFLEQPR